MSGLRRYVGMLATVCVAFAAGIALGNGPLQGESTGDGHVSLTAANAELSAELQAARRVQAFESALGSAARPALLRDRLSRVSVGIFSLPGVAPETVTAVAGAVEEAGGELTVRARISPTLVDPARKTYVDSVASGALEDAADVRALGALSPYARIGALLARAYTGTADEVAVDDEAARLDAQLRGAKLLWLADPLQRRASAVVVLTPGDTGQSGAVYAAHQIELPVLDALAARADGVLLAGPAAASAPGGLILAATQAPSMTHAVATLNALDMPAGPAAAVGGLAAAVSGHPGTWGMRGDVPAVPPGFGSAG